jgi:hypothetical protein
MVYSESCPDPKFIITTSFRPILRRSVAESMLVHPILRRSVAESMPVHPILRRSVAESTIVAKNVPILATVSQTLQPLGQV